MSINLVKILVFISYFNLTKCLNGPSISREETVKCIFHDGKYKCDCANSAEKLFLPKLSDYSFQIIVSNCRNLFVEPNTITSIKSLNKVSFNNIQNLTLASNSLDFHGINNPSLILEFEQVNFAQIQPHAFGGYIDEINFFQGIISEINPFAFTSLQNKAKIIKFTNINFERIDAQAFKKFTIDRLEIENCTFSTDLPSKSFYEIQILKNFRIWNSTFKGLYSAAFHLKETSRFLLIENHFNHLEGESFKAIIGKEILLEKNNFGLVFGYAFRGLLLSKDYYIHHSEKPELRFYYNELELKTTTSLEFEESFIVRLRQVNLINEFNCKTAMELNSIELFKLNTDTIIFTNENHLTFKTLLEKSCKQKSYFFIFIIGTVIFIFVIILFFFVFCYFKNTSKKPQNIILPEPKTYRETQIILQVENMQLMKTDL